VLCPMIRPDGWLASALTLRSRGSQVPVPNGLDLIGRMELGDARGYRRRCRGSRRGGRGIG